MQQQQRMLSAWWLQRPGGALSGSTELLPAASKAGAITLFSTTASCCVTQPMPMLVLSRGSGQTAPHTALLLGLRCKFSI